MDPTPRPLPDAEQVRAVTREILARPEFRDSSETPGFLKDLLEQLAALLSLLPLLPRWAPTLLFWALLAVAVFFLFRLILGFQVGHTASRRGRLAAPTVDVLEGNATSWEHALEMAADALGEGDLRRAVWISHRVLLAFLDQDGIIRFSGAKTNSAYLRECPAGHPSFPLLSRLTEVYDRVIYGGLAGSSVQVQELIGEVARLGKARGGA